MVSGPFLPIVRDEKLQIQLEDYSQDREISSLIETNVVGLNIDHENAAEGKRIQRGLLLEVLVTLLLPLTTIDTFNIHDKDGFCVRVLRMSGDTTSAAFV